MELTPEHADRIVRQISSVVNPATIVLFGSYARGDAHDGSDLDILVIQERDFKPGESRRRQLGALYRAVSELPAIPKDILLFTRGEFLDWKGTTNHMAAAAWREGRVLHGAV